MSLIGVGRVGLRPNSDNVTNFTLFFWRLPLAKIWTFFQKIQIFYFFKVLMAIKLNSKTYLRGAIFWYRPSFIKKMQNFLLNCSPWPNKSERVAELRGAESLGLWLLKFWILWKSKDGLLRNFKFCKVDFFSNMKQVFGKFFFPAFRYWF